MFHPYLVFRKDMLPELTNIQHETTSDDVKSLTMDKRATNSVLVPRNFTPLELKKIYNMPTTSSQNKRLRVVVPSFGGGLFGAWNPTTKKLENGDCQKFWTRLGIPLHQQATVRINLLSGSKNNPTTSDGGTYENSLDCQILGSINSNLDIDLTIAPNSAQGFFDVLDYCLATKPNFVSFSWGLPESLASIGFLQAANEKLKQLADLGITVTTASGDNGSHNGQEQPTTDFPASSPWVVSCGGTRLLCTTDNVYNSSTQETVWNNNPQSSATGGGRSKVFPLPFYQKDIPGITGGFRCGPDIAGAADTQTGCYFMVNDVLVFSGGTSVVSPLICGYFSLTNLNSFANPLIYSAPASCFHDIVSGNNGAYSATKGFDLTTGFGSIDGMALISAFQPVVLKISPSTLRFMGTTKPQQLTIVFDPPNTSNKTIVGTWSSSNPQIATCDQNGLVTPVSNGICQIAHSAVTSMVVPVIVTNVSILVTNLTLMPQVRVGEQAQFHVQFVPANATNKNIGWTSLTPEVASVNANTGVITGLTRGVAVIRATSRDARKTSKTVEIRVV